MGAAGIDNVIDFKIEIHEKCHHDLPNINERNVEGSCMNILHYSLNKIQRSVSQSNLKISGLHN